MPDRLPRGLGQPVGCSPRLLSLCLLSTLRVNKPSRRFKMTPLSGEKPRPSPARPQAIADSLVQRGGSAAAGGVSGICQSQRKSLKIASIPAIGGLSG